MVLESKIAKFSDEHVKWGSIYVTAKWDLGAYKASTALEALRYVYTGALKEDLSCDELLDICQLAFDSDMDEVFKV